MPITIIVNNTEYSLYALLDDGATVSFVDSSVCNFSGPSYPLRIVSVRGLVMTNNNSCKVTALIRGLNGVCHGIALRTIENLDLLTQFVPTRVLNKNKHLRELDLCQMSFAKPMILIGQDNWRLIVNSTGKIRATRSVPHKVRVGYTRTCNCRYR